MKYEELKELDLSKSKGTLQNSLRKFVSLIERMQSILNKYDNLRSQELNLPDARKLEQALLDASEGLINTVTSLKTVREAATLSREIEGVVVELEDFQGDVNQILRTLQFHYHATEHERYKGIIKQIYGLLKRVKDEAGELSKGIDAVLTGEPETAEFGRLARA